jgi:hypothetical protein
MEIFKLGEIFDEVKLSEIRNMLIDIIKLLEEEYSNNNYGEKFKISLARSLEATSNAFRTIEDNLEYQVYYDEFEEKMRPISKREEFKTKHVGRAMIMLKSLYNLYDKLKD